MDNNANIDIINVAILYGLSSHTAHSWHLVALMLL